MLPKLISMESLIHVVKIVYRILICSREESKRVVIKEENMEKLFESYFDKNGKEIKKGMVLRHNDGTLDTVYEGDTELGFIANKDGSLIYPLSEFNLLDWEIVQNTIKK